MNPTIETRELMRRGFEVGYICGLVTGEGSFTGDKKSPCLAMKLHVDDQLPLTFLLSRLGGNLYGPYEHDRRRYYLWRLTGTPLKNSLVLFQDYLPPSKKREQFEAWRRRYNI